jgi:hypothetical protein
VNRTGVDGKWFEESLCFSPIGEKIRAFEISKEVRISDLNLECEVIEYRKTFQLKKDRRNSVYRSFSQQQRNNYQNVFY